MRAIPLNGVGMMLGERGRLIDVEIDAESPADQAEAAAILARLFGGPKPPTLGWGSARGGHNAFRWDARLASYPAKLEIGPVELRFGSPADAAKQFQSAIPPTVGTDGEPRRWNGVAAVAELPECFFRELAAMVAEKPASVPVVRRSPGDWPMDHDRDIALAREALSVLSPDCGYDQWIRIGMSLASLGDDGLTLWDEWSAGGESYKGTHDLESHWRSFRDKPGGITLGTLFAMARDNGWTHPGGSVPVGTDPGGLFVHPVRAGSGIPDGSGTPDGTEPVPHRGTVPTILIGPDEHRVNDAAIEALTRDDAVFQRAGSLVTIRRVEAMVSRGLKRQPGTPTITAIPPATLRELMTRNARWAKVNAKGETVRAHPPDWSVNAVAARGEWPGIRTLGAVVEAPTLRDDGTVLETPGYDPLSGLFYAPDGTFPPIPGRPTRDDARRAADELFEIVCDFPFSGPEHRAAWLAGLLTLPARFATNGSVPLFMVDANCPGAGKGKLVDLCSIVATGRMVSKIDLPDSNEEVRKMLLTVAMEGDRLVCLDNVAGTFGGSALDSAPTAGTIKGRILGKSQMTPELPMVATFYGTGNNVAYKGDFLRRVVPIRLESPNERPECRTGFKYPDLLGHAADSRGRLLVAALTILRGWFHAGCPDAGLTPFGSFEEWSRIVRGAVHWAVGVDPLLTREGLVENDPESLSRLALVEGWAELPDARNGVTVAGALDYLRRCPDDLQTLRAALMANARGADLPDGRSIGYRLRAVRGRVVNGKKLERVSHRAGVVAWKIITTKPDGGGDGGNGGDVSNPVRKNFDSECTQVEMNTPEILPGPTGNIPTIPTIPTIERLADAGPGTEARTPDDDDDPEMDPVAWAALMGFHPIDMPSNASLAPTDRPVTL